MDRYLTVVFLSTALAGSVSVRADDHYSNSQTKRYYDKDARDYHEWNQHEDQVYHQYVTENHKRDREFAKTIRAEKKDYSKYQATTSGVSTPFICDDFIDDSYVSEAGTADLSGVASPGKSAKWGQGNPQRYNEAAWLSEQLLLPANSSPTKLDDITLAIWDTFDPGRPGAINYQASYDGVSTLAEQYVTAAQGEFANAHVDAVDPRYSITCGGAACPTSGLPQEFQVATPEPPAPVLLAFDLLSLLALVLFLRRRALRNASLS